MQLKKKIAYTFVLQSSMIEAFQVIFDGKIIDKPTLLDAAIKLSTIINDAFDAYCVLRKLHGITPLIIDCWKVCMQGLFDSMLQTKILCLQLAVGTPRSAANPLYMLPLIIRHMSIFNFFFSETLFLHFHKKHQGK